MRVGVRVAIGFGTVLALTAFVGGIGWKGLGDYAGSVDRTQRMKQLTDGVLSAADAAARYHLTTDQAAVETARSHLDAVQQAVRELAADGTELARVGAAATAFRDGLDRFVAIDAENRSRLLKMQENVSRIEHAADEIVRAQDLVYATLSGEMRRSDEDQKLRLEMSEMVNAIVRSFLAAKLASSRYESAAAPNHAEAFHKSMDEAVATADRLWEAAMLTDLASLVGTLAEAVRGYQEAFRELEKAYSTGDLGNLPNLILAMYERGDAADKVMTAFDSDNRKEHISAVESAERAREKVGLAIVARGDSMRLIGFAQELDAAGLRLVAQQGSAAAAKRARTAAGKVAEAVGTFAKVEDTKSREMLDAIRAVAKEHGELLETVIDQLDKRGQAIAEMNAARDDALALVGEASKGVTEMMAEGRRFSEVMIALGTAVALLGGLVLAYVIGRSVSGPIRRMTAAMRRLADNEQAVEVPDRQRRDEFGAMAAAVQVFKENAETMRSMEEQQEAERRRAEEEKRRALSRLADEFEEEVRGVVDAVSASAEGMRNSAASLTEVAGRVAEQSTSVSAATTQSSANVSTAASATEELASSIAEIGRQIDETSRVTADAVERAAATGTAIRGLASDAQKIGEVVGIITEIAEQTNLLALNATIEAARAGDAGKGFAVVASEVKNLANQTAKATGDIETRVTAIQTATADVVKGIETIGAVIGKISEIATSVASAVEEQGAATQEISRNVLEASKGAQTVAESVAGMNADATQAGHAARDVHGASAKLSSQADALRTDVDRFIRHIRSDQT